MWFVLSTTRASLRPFQILLIFETLIRRDHDSKPGIFCCLQQITVDKPSPTQFLSRADVVLREITQ
jgi:hypothetical protein